ncbi:hypothetical protein DFS34DRAFT_620420 [Phlyctochytrium arcticum]|nr:hypothetical protein DFS34DRAFT_620420 [Phlyctochytrium arcticum]
MSKGNGVTSHRLVAISEGRGFATEVGMAMFNLRTNVCQLYQFVDSHAYIKTLSKILLMEPTEIIVSATVFTPTKSKLLQAIEAHVTDCQIVPVSRNTFNDNHGLNYVQQYGLEDEQDGAISPALPSRFYCLAATAALFKHAASKNNIYFVNRSIRFKLEMVDGLMMIDHTTASGLELVTNNAGKTRDSLFGVLNNTHTVMGARLLRINVLQPPFDLSTIEARLDTVEELTEHEVLMQSLPQIFFWWRMKRPHIRQ